MLLGHSLALTATLLISAEMVSFWFNITKYMAGAKGSLYALGATLFTVFLSFRLLFLFQVNLSK